MKAAINRMISGRHKVEGKMKNVRVKKIAGNAIAVVIFVLLLCFGMEFDIRVLLSLRLCGIMLTGIGILFIPHLIQGIERREIPVLIGVNARLAGYIGTLIMLFFSVNNMPGAEEVKTGESIAAVLLHEIALSFRPLLYGLLVYEVCGAGKKERRGMEAAAVPPPDVAAGADSAANAAAEVLGINGAEQKAEFIPAGETELRPLRERLGTMGLTAREEQIALLIHAGLSNKEIAEELFIAEATVKKHVSNLFAKLGVERRSQIK